MEKFNSEEEYFLSEYKSAFNNWQEAICEYDRSVNDLFENKSDVFTALETVRKKDQEMAGKEKKYRIARNNIIKFKTNK